MSRSDLIIKPQPGMQETAFLALHYGVDEVLMGGMAGPGKTWTHLALDVPDALDTPDLRSLILRRRTPDMGDMIEKAADLYLPLGASFTGQDRYYKRPAYIFDSGAKIIFSHMEQEQDKYMYQGWEIPRIRVEEVGQFTESQYLYLFSRNRNSYGIRNQMSGTCNPQGIGMLWLKRRFIDKLKPKQIKFFRAINGVDTEVPPWSRHSMSRMWIPGVRSENQFLDHDVYEARLASLGAADQKALRYGLWELEPTKMQLINPKWLDWAMSGAVKPLKGRINDFHAIGADYGSCGADESVKITGKGNKVTGIYEEKKSRTGDFALQLYRDVARLGRFATTLGVDGNSWGAGVCDLLEDTYELGDILNRMTHKNPNYKPRRKGDWKFDCMRSQMWWEFALDMEDGLIDLSWFSSPECGYNQTHYLIEEIFAHEYDTSSGFLRVTPKEVLAKAERLGRSPNRADALVIWNWVRKRTEIDSIGGQDDQSFGDYRAMEEVRNENATSSWL